MTKIIILFFILTTAQLSVAEEIKREDFLATQKYSGCVESLMDSEAKPRESDPSLEEYWLEKYYEDKSRYGFVDFADAQAKQSASASGFMTHKYGDVSFPGEQDGQRGVYKQERNGFIFIPLPEGSGESVEFNEDVVLKKNSTGEVEESKRLTRKYERFDLSEVEYETKVEGQLESVKAIHEDESYPVVNFPAEQWDEPYETRRSGIIHCIKAPCPQSEAMQKLTKKPWTKIGLLDVDNPNVEDGVKAKKTKIKAVAAKPEALSQSLAYALDGLAETYVSQCTETALGSSGFNFLGRREGFPENYNEHYSRNLVSAPDKSESCIEKLKTCQDVTDSRISKTVSSIAARIGQAEERAKAGFGFGEHIGSNDFKGSLNINQSQRGSADSGVKSNNRSNSFESQGSSR